MVTVYHGTTTLFAKADFSRIKNDSSYGTNEYGYGFYAGDVGDATERVSSAIHSNKPAFILSMEIPDETYTQKWLDPDNTLPQQTLDNIVDKLESKGLNQMAASIKEAGQDISGGDLYNQIMISDAKERSQFWTDLGIDGRRSGSYYVFFHEGAVPEFNIPRAFNYKSDAKADLAALKALDNAAITPELELLAAGTNFNSEIAQQGYDVLLEQTKNPELCRQYLELIEMSKDKSVTGDGFAMRERLGYSIIRAFTTNQKQAYFGTTLLDTSHVQESLNPGEKGNAYLQKFNSFTDRLKQDPRIHTYLEKAPQSTTPAQTRTPAQAQ